MSDICEPPHSSLMCRQQSCSSAVIACPGRAHAMSGAETSSRARNRQTGLEIKNTVDKSKRFNGPFCEPGHIRWARAARKRIFPGHRFVKMSFFALDFKIKMPYPLAPPQGWEVHFGSLKTRARPTFNHKVEKLDFHSLARAVGPG